ncbi:Protein MICRORCHIDIA 2 [Vitis vinifera]|uniref:Protein MICRORCHIDIA 2 n=1 Tax=Vitis vinifera TaxID=29760 RepID=A0A438K5Z7_VITVI|nr:Protein MICRORCHIDIA 2 [Vitis vinifera]
MSPMSLKPEKEGMDVVEIASSDDEGGVGVERTSNQQVQTDQVGQQTVVPLPPAEPPLSRSFWKAGAYDNTPSKLTPAPDQLEHARVHPKFLHSNATSHKWAFGGKFLCHKNKRKKGIAAIAELLDNAVDELWWFFLTCTYSPNRWTVG